MAAQLRIYHGPSTESASPNDNTVSLPASEVLPLLADAYASRRTWLQDFADDEVTISADLFEVLAAYQYYRRPTA